MTAAGVEAAATFDETAVPVHLDPKLAGRRRDASLRYKLLTDQQQGTFILREIPYGLRRAPDIDWPRVPAKVAIHLFFGHGIRHPSRWRLLLAAGAPGTNGLEPATIIVAIACAKGVPLELQVRFGPQAITAVTNAQWAAFGADRTYMGLHYSELSHYSSICAHLRDYRERLNAWQKIDLAEYFLPEMPSRFVDRYVPTRAVHLERRQRRKAKLTYSPPLCTSWSRLSSDAKRRCSVY